MTKEQAIRRAMTLTVARKEPFVALEERFERHRPSYHVRDERSWNTARRSRAMYRNSVYENWREVWPTCEDER